MTEQSSVPVPDSEGGGLTHDFDEEALARGRAIAKRTLWGMMIAAALLVLAGWVLDQWLAVGVMLVGFSYPLLKVLREYRRPDDFTKPRYWDVVSRVLERHEDAAEPAGSAGLSVTERRVRIQDDMDHIRRLGSKPKSVGDDSLWPPALLTLGTAIAGVLYLVVGHNTAAGVAWFCMSAFVAGLGWLRKTMRGKERKALALLEEELKELGGGPPPADP